MKELVLLSTVAVTILCSFQSCGNSKMARMTSDVFVYQNGTEIEIKGVSQEVELDRKEFSIRFLNRQYDSDTKEFYAAQITAFKDKNELSKIKVGLSKQDLPCFEPSSGMAPYESGSYESLIFSNEGHHYLFYENHDRKRVELIWQMGDNLKLEFPISSFHVDGNDVSMNDLPLSEFYLAILIDKNLNGIIESGELTKLTLKFK
ncbi:MAG: hypothetical protein IH946_04495 [Bacteroidetes bacterium]|nr:hypothetical protein [Bacteroidota bacterium]